MKIYLISIIIAIEIPSLILSIITTVVATFLLISSKLPLRTLTATIPHYSRTITIIAIRFI